MLLLAHSACFFSSFASLLAKQTYGNGDYIDFTYDNLDRVTKKVYNGDASTAVQYAYDSEGRTSTIKDTENSRYTRFTYDLAGRVVRNATYPNASASSAFVTDMRYNYESKTNRLSDFTYRMPKHGSTTGDYRTADFNLIYGIGADADRVTALQMHKVNRIQFAYDGFGRVTSRTYSNTTGDNRRVTTYTYQDVGADKTTTLLKTVNNSGIGLLGYEYDAVGNIAQISKDGTVQESYTYDDLNQLKTVTRNGVTTNYTYQNGNIQSVTQDGEPVKTYGYTDSTWGDLLTSFNGQTITYDAIGNPLQYRDGMSFTWAKGRQLQGIAKDGLNASYTYDENGLRLSKNVNGVTTKIFRTNGQMVGMNMSDGKDMTFLLDGDGKVYGVHYDHYSFDQKKTETYYFAFNAQGDVIGIYEFYGKVIATYDYDEWGNCTVNVLCEDSNGHAVDSPDHIAQVNPFRYRGYFYDAETGFYYLNSRYYDPGTGRFVNADGYTQTGQGLLDKNMFAYCLNNPVMFCDSSGCYVEYTISYPAEGRGPVEITDYTGNYNYSVDASCDNGVWTYTVTQTPTVEYDNSDIINFLGDELSNFAIEDFFTSGGELPSALRSNSLLYKNICTVATASTVSFAIFASQISWDYEQYNSNLKRMAISMTITTVSTLISVGGGLIIESACAHPAVAATGLSPAILLVGSFIVGCGISYVEDLARTRFVGETYIYY